MFRKRLLIDAYMFILDGRLHSCIERARAQLTLMPLCCHACAAGLLPPLCAQATPEEEVCIRTLIHIQRTLLAPSFT